MTINHIQYNGSSEELFKIWLWVILLNILTLGVYSFWGRTLLRQYLAEHCQIEKTNFNYLGQGAELFKGFLKALPLWILLILGFKIFEDTALEDAYAVVMSIIIVQLTFVAIFSSLRYRLAHIQWRGIRGNLRGSAWLYGLQALWFSIVSILSLGLMFGWMDHHLYRNKLNKIKVGGLPVMYIGNAKDLFKINFITILLAIPTLFLSRIWYVACVRHYVYNRTQIGDCTLVNTESGKELVKIYVWGFFVTVFSLGLLYPLVIQRKMYYITQHFSIRGDLSTLIAELEQPFAATSGEGLYTVMDAETDLW
jgi:uncharacterized membrane protein YjgN (DUF898 family)